MPRYNYCTFKNTLFWRTQNLSQLALFSLYTQLCTKTIISSKWVNADNLDILQTCMKCCQQSHGLWPVHMLQIQVWTQWPLRVTETESTSLGGIVCFLLQMLFENFCYCQQSANRVTRCQMCSFLPLQSPIFQTTFLGSYMAEDLAGWSMCELCKK